MNWGNKLVLVFVVFVALIGTLAYKSINTKFELVSKEYYKDELKYQARIDATKASSKLSKVGILQTKDSIIIEFPTELNKMLISGDVWYYCPTDEKKDLHFKFSDINNNRLLIDKKLVKKSNYQVKVNYKANDINYYSEENIIVE
ncbi:MAG: FixH family protein [Chitinophagaceae bacterium]